MHIWQVSGPWGRMSAILAVLFFLLMGCGGGGDSSDESEDVAGGDVAGQLLGDGNSVPVPPGEILENVDCTPSMAAPASGCVVETGGESLLIEGVVLGPKGLFRDGGVLISSTGTIDCVGCDCAASGNNPTKMRCAGAIISPGLINTHDHMGWMQNAPAQWGTERYEHRHDWRKGLRGHNKISASGGASTDEKAWGELRQLMGGATSLAGSGSTGGFLRNVDSDKQEELGQPSVDLDTFPLGDSGGDFRTNDCNYPKVPGNQALAEAAYVPHVAEGIDAEAHNELMCLTSSDRGGFDVAEPNASFIHVVAADPADAAALADGGTTVIWSPRSNISLYGNTAPVTMLDTMGVRLALGTDWAPSGSINVLRELQCADYLNYTHYGAYFSSRDIWKMSTVNAAGALAVDDVVGSLAPGMIADVAVFRGTDGDDPYDDLINAGIEDVLLVLRGGKPLYGDSAAVAAVNESPMRNWSGTPDTCDSIPGGVCGEERSVCVQSELGMSFDQLAQINASSYALFFCNVPPGEPTCVPSRPGEYQGGVGVGDIDGDGLADAEDNCPGIFNPIRPMDEGVQADLDADGVGDSCDPCPMDANTDQCTKPNPEDRDADGIGNVADNCPNHANVDQADQDDDGKGDLCDPCPDISNPGSQGCPASIYAVKMGDIGIGEQVAVTAVVSGVASPSFFLQVPVDMQDANMGAQYSGIFVYMGSAEDPNMPTPTVGSLVRVTGETSEFYGQKQLNNVGAIEVLPGGQALEPVVIADPADVATGGQMAEAYEGVLIHVVGAVTSHNPPAGPGDDDPTHEFVLDGLRVNDYMYHTDTLPAVGEALAVTGVLRYSSQDYKLEPRSADDIQLDPNAPPRILSLSPETVYMDEGTSVTHPDLILSLNIAAKEAVVVTLNSDNTSVATVPSTITVPKGSKTVVVPVDGISATSQAVEIQASLDGESKKGWVRVLDPDRTPMVSPVNPNSISIFSGKTKDVVVGLEVPAPEAGATITASITGSGFTVAPAAQQLSAWDTETTFTVTATSGQGGGEISFETPISKTTLTVTVSDMPLLGMVFSEVLHNPDGSDDKQEWVEIYNGTSNDVDLSGYSIGYSDGGKVDQGYAAHTYALSGTVEAGACVVVGGPSTSAANGNPTYQQTGDFDPDIQNSSKGCAIGLFSVPQDQITSQTVPVDGLIYGDDNSRGFMDSNGGIPNNAHITSAPSGNTLERTLTGWQLQENPNPGLCAF